MASVCSPRQQLAPTVGPAAALAGFHIRAGLFTISGERVVNGLVYRLGSLDFINNNAGCFYNGGKFPKNGRIIEFGSHRVYLATVPVRQYPSPVLVAPDPPRSDRGLRSGCTAGSVKVLVVGAADAGKEAAAEGAGQTKSARMAKPPIERDQVAAGTSAAPPETPLQAAMSVLATPIAQNIDPAAAQAELEATRKKLLSGGAEIIRAQRELNLTLHEYKAAHGFASVSAQPARVPENRLRARNLDQDLRREVLAGKSTSASLSIVEKPKYSSPDKIIKAAKAKESALVSFLHENRNIFAWSTDDLVGVPRELAEHSLNVRKDAKPVRQPLRWFTEERRKIIGEEVTKLLVAGFIVEVLHTEWLANPVLVEKKKVEDPKAPKVWRMCIDYTNLNKECPKDPFPLPRIDQADAAFKELKQMLATAPVLASPLEREPMLLYIAATNRVVSVVVVVEREEEGKTVQRLVYYLSEVLSLSKQNYPHFQKMTYGVFMAATKLKHYFEEHPMKVVSEAPISDIMCNKDASEAVIPTDIIHDSPRVQLYTKEEVKEARENDLDLLEEARELALARTAIYQQNLRRYHSRKVNPRVFREGDLVLRLVQRTGGRHKLAPTWEGPFIVSKALHNDAYYLIDAQESKKGKADRSGDETKRPWSIALLRPFYS
ncbi:hypothetical protein QYE76_004530 [Lolium multiflorum]|uniref:Reverse transcriptase/retrotransposon-derived protein RNase H-like domain-containing protein n=1 Tax=Lolium multiflorum TaxID=4521 RepID=A0AAD8RRC2_LOLMU|nr:hypothetical protein QYE76_004530 [Lolium multiflorum]